MAKPFKKGYSFFRDYTQRARNRKLKAGLFSGVFISLFLIIFNISMFDVTPSKSADAAKADIPAAEPSENNPYNVYPHYLEDKLYQYRAYKLKFPEMDASDVLWQVNAGLNFNFYTNISEIKTETPFLVNKYNRLPEDYVPDELVALDYGHLVTPGTKEAFERMRKDAISQGYTIDVASGYRSFDAQKSLYEKLADSLGQELADKSVERAGFSEHQTGRALDITGSSEGLNEFVNTPEFTWVMENCENYGFIIRYHDHSEQITGYNSEPWHITFVGKTIALDMKSKAIKTLEEYVAKNLDILNIQLIDDRRVVALDAGHGGSDPGGSKNGVNEKDINLDIALNLKELLELDGIRVIMVRTSDEYIENIERTKKANESAEIFISIHQNAFEDESVYGVETWYNSQQQDSLKLAKLVHSNLLSTIKSADRGLYDNKELIALRTAAIPAVLVETGYISNDSELNLLMDIEYRQKIATGIYKGIISFFEPKTMYLTFDDGPSPKNTPIILDILKDRNIKATFFVVGENAEKYPELLKRIVNEGHGIGIHCYSHEYKPLYKSVETYMNDFYKARNIVFNITGIEPAIYRFPGGSINNFNKKVYQQIIDEMNRKGFVYYDWNASIEDAWQGVKPSDLIQNAKNEVNGQKNVILLSHDTSSCTAEALGEIIDLFPEYKMEVITKDTKPVQFAPRK